MWNFRLSICLGVDVWYQCVWFGSWGPDYNNIKQPIKSKSVDCLIVGLLPFMIILITVSLSFKIYNKASFREEFNVWRSKNKVEQIIDHSWDSFFRWRFIRVSSYLFISDACFREELWRLDPIYQVRIYRPSFKPAPKEMISDFVEFVQNWSLFLTHPNYWNKCMTFKNAQCSTWSRFRIFKISRKIGVMKHFSLHCFAVVSHMTILFVITCMMNVRDQTR